MPTRDLDHQTFREQVDAFVAGALDGDDAAAMLAHASACPACAAVLAGAEAQDVAIRDTFAGARPRADLEDHLVARFRMNPQPQKGVWVHPTVRRAAIGVAAALLLGGFGLVTTTVVERGGLPVPFALASKGSPASVAVRSGDANVDLLVEGESRSKWSENFYDYGQRVDNRAPPIRSPSEMAWHFNKSLADRPGATPLDRVQTDAQVHTRWYAAIPQNETNAPSGGAAPADPARRPVVAAKPGSGAADAKADAEKLTQLHDFDGTTDLYGYKAQAGEAGKAYKQGAPVAAGGATGTGGGAATGDGMLAVPNRGVNPNGQSTLAYGTVQLGANIERQSGADVLAKAIDSRSDAAGATPEFVDAFRPDDYLARAKEPAGADKDVAEKDVEAALGETKFADTPSDQQAQGGQDAAPPPPAAQPAPAEPAQPPVQPPAVQPPVSPTHGRKIIRNGEMSFEVDGFDSAAMQVGRIAAEEGGFVATTDSEKLANGKVRGTITVRVPPDRLDTLVLKLRGLGDLKSSKLAANDITKQYTDLESQLRASRAMEERLLNIIKTGKGEIKDLVEAEKQLGVYRERIEQVEGEIRYYANLVSLSTLNVTLTERDIRTAALLSETEQVNMGVEAVDVEEARAAAIQAIDEAKGRIVESDLKKLQAGQFAARVVADVPPDAAGPLIDRMKQIGNVARLEIERKQSAPEGTVAPQRGPGAGPRVERRETRFLISLYNLANVAPRQTTTLNLAAEDVEAAYRSILDQVKSAGGRVVTSQLNRPRPDQTTGTITFEAPSEGADVLLGAVRAAGEVMRLEASQNPDAQNVTEAKRGFVVQVFSMAAVAPRETTSLRVAARGVADAFNKLREAVRVTEGTRILSSQLAEQDPANVSGSLDFEVRRADWAAVETALREAGQVVSRNVTRSADAENTVDTKVRLQVVLVDEAALQPRESVTVQLAVADVPAQYAKLLEAAQAGQARVLQSQLAEQENRNDVVGTLAFDVRRESRAALDRALADAGDVISRSVSRSTDTQNTLDDKVRITLTLTDADRLAPRETTTLGLEVKDVDRAKEQIQSLAIALGGRVVDSTLSREQNGRVMGKVVADVPLAKALEMVQKTRDAGRIQFRRDARDENVPEGSLARARVDVTLANEELLVESGQGLGARIRDGLRTSLTGLLWSVQLIVVGLFLVAPWVLIVWFAWKMIRRGKSRRAGAPSVA